MRTISRSLICLFCSLILGAILPGQAQNPGTGLFPGQDGQIVVLENGFPALKFFSQTGSVAFVYFRKYENEDAFAIPVLDLDNTKTHSGWLYITQTRVVFEPDDAKKRSFNVLRGDIKDVKYVKGRPPFVYEHMEMKVSGKGKRLMIMFTPLSLLARERRQKLVALVTFLLEQQRNAD